MEAQLMEILRLCISKAPLLPVTPTHNVLGADGFTCVFSPRGDFNLCKIMGAASFLRRKQASGGDIPRGSQQLTSAREGKIKTATDVWGNYLTIHCGHPRSQ